MNNLPVKILLVEDDEDDFILTRDMLSSSADGHYQLDWVSTYEEALETISQKQHDAYLIDFRLGAYSGLDLLAEASARGCHAPLILLTGAGGYEVDLAAMNAGASDYLAKNEMTPPLLERSIRFAIERKRSEEHIRQTAERAEALVRIASRLNSQLDLQTVLNTICEEGSRALSIPTVSLYLFDQQTRSFYLGACIGMPDGYSLCPPNETYSIYNYKELHNVLNMSLIREEQIIGSLNLYTLGPARHFTDDDIALLKGLADQGATAIANASLLRALQQTNNDLSQAYDTTLLGWMQALELRDKDTEGHTQRVANLTIELARQMGIDDEELIHVRRGALLHDIGKIAIPDEILRKPGPLSQQEWEVMQRHPIYAYQLLSPISFLRPALDIPYCHHEKWAEEGYPRGLNGEDIPLSARIFSVADVWDALTTDRPYRQAWPETKAKKYIAKEAGKQFDPQVVEVFLDLIQGSD